jgi:hypothetical protein
MTGRPARLPPGLVNTLRNRQFSEVPGLPKGDAGSGQCGANAVAARTPVQCAGGSGACQRSAPAGGAAYGMPRNSRIPPATSPRTAPDCVVATSPPAAAVAPAGAGPADVAQPASAPAAITPHAITPAAIRARSRPPVAFLGIPISSYLAPR